MLLRALGLEAPRYGHLALLVGADGSPLSKRNGSLSVRELREAGYLPAAVLNYLARLGHNCERDEWLDPDELAACFSLQRLGRSPARFDASQLQRWQKQSVERLDDAAFRAWLETSEAGRRVLEQVPPARHDAFLACIRDNVAFPADALDWSGRLFGELPAPGAGEAGALREAGAAFFEAALEAAGEDDFGTFAKRLGKATGRRGKALYLPLRIALTGTAHGPEMARVWTLLGPERRRERLAAAARTADAAARPNP
ncbi:MAG TPA: hypothetical protein ENK12_09530 [Gammaproteobacteria bacterium]|nr:hypothetical protein [Gammaproteobacteria bacterium]